MLPCRLGFAPKSITTGIHKMPRTKLQLAARAAADRVPFVYGVVFGWRDAKAQAPASALPLEQQPEFRRAYAERLVERGLARPASAPKPGRSGGAPHSKDRIKVSFTPAQRTRWERAANGKPLARWLAELADRAS
jgi:hypothetical protein